MQSKNKYYKSCSTLPLFNFYQILNTKDLSWLIRGREADDDPIKLTDQENEYLTQLWFEITCEYNDLLGEKINSTQYVIVAQLSEYVRELEIVSSILSLFLVSRSEALKMQLELWGYFPDDIDKSKKKLEQLKFKIDFIRTKNKDLFKVEETENTEKVKHNLYADVVLFENSMNMTIDVHKTVIEKWVMIMLRHNEIQNHRKKSMSNKKG